MHVLDHKEDELSKKLIWILRDQFVWLSLRRLRNVYNSIRNENVKLLTPEPVYINVLLRNTKYWGKKSKNTQKSLSASDISDHKDPLLNHLKPRNEKF